MHLAGLVGQSFSAPGPHNGKRDFYPTEGRFRTSAMAEGAIEGSAEMYRLPSGDTVEFDFSRFYTAALASRPGGLLLAAGEASAVDEGGDGGGPGAVAASGRPSRRLSEQDCDSDGIPDAEVPTPPPPSLPPRAPCLARLSTADGTFEALDSVASGKESGFAYNSNVKGPGEDKGGWRQAGQTADSWKCPVDTAGTQRT